MPETTEICAICLTEMYESNLFLLETTQCRHQFHRECLTECYTLGLSTCPMCRQDLPYERMRALMNYEDYKTSIRLYNENDLTPTVLMLSIIEQVGDSIDVLIDRLRIHYAGLYYKDRRYPQVYGLTIQEFEKLLNFSFESDVSYMMSNRGMADEACDFLFSNEGKPWDYFEVMEI